MKANTFKITIDSIFGGISAYSNFSDSDQFTYCSGIDSDMRLDNLNPAGYITPTFYQSIGTVPASRDIMQFTPEPKGNTIYAFDSSGSVYTIVTFGNTATFSGLGNINSEGTTEAFSGSDYYDNYVYYARNTTIGRYGPLDGSPSFNRDYWGTTLSKTALNTPFNGYPNLGTDRIQSHFMHRHSDGKLYFTDVVGNQGVIHYISTSKSSVEGDTDNGSTYNALDFGYGFFPLAIESYGSDLAISLFEGGASGSNIKSKRAKVAFWNTTNTNTYDYILSEEFPDQVITAMKNSNGILYTFSGNTGTGSGLRRGTRICRFVGGYSFEEVAYLENVFPPLPGAVDAVLNQVLMGSSQTSPTSTTNTSVISVGSKSSPISKNVYNIFSIGSGVLKSISLAISDGLFGQRLLVASKQNVYLQITKGNEDIATTEAEFMSRVFRIGQKFKITKLAFNLSLSVANLVTSIVPKFFIDDMTTTKTLTTINSSYKPTGNRIVIRPENCAGNSNFALDFAFSGSMTASDSLYGITLPITIEGEYIDD